MKSTIGKKKFKKKFGQANHFLITTLIGLDIVEKSDGITKSKDFATSWNPKNQIASARRSRMFVLESFFSYIVDGIDMYLSSLQKKPLLINDEQFFVQLNNSGSSVYLKLKVISEYLSIQDYYIKDLVLLLVTWRNNVVHFNSSQKLHPQTKTNLLANSNKINDCFCHLDIKEVINKAEKGDTPTFKEVTSLIKATHDFVNLIDNNIINKMNIEEYSIRVINNILKDKTIYAKYNSLTVNQKIRYKCNLLKNFAGFDDEDIKNYITHSNIE